PWKCSSPAPRGATAARRSAATGKAAASSGIPATASGIAASSVPTRTHGGIPERIEKRPAKGRGNNQQRNEDHERQKEETALGIGRLLLVEAQRGQLLPLRRIRSQDGDDVIDTTRHSATEIACLEAGRNGIGNDDF